MDDEIIILNDDELESRPVYVWTKEHIESHFLTCFVSLVILRLLEQKANKKYSISKMIESIKNFECINEFTNVYLLFNNNSIIEYLNSIFYMDTIKKRLTKAKIKNILNY